LGHLTIERLKEEETREIGKDKSKIKQFIFYYDI